ncbi:UNVERIFIED_CONTAM: hypothetical protein FKN15_064067 [Acipenser sinensis]
MFKEWATVTAALQLLLLQVTGQAVKSGLCIENDCYTIHQDSKTFQNANDVCSTQQGHLMTVRSTVANDAMSTLMANEHGDFWIGLHLPEGQCTNNDITLRGYEWHATLALGDETFYDICVAFQPKVLRKRLDKAMGTECPSPVTESSEALRAPVPSLLQLSQSPSQGIPCPQAQPPPQPLAATPHLHRRQSGSST